METQNLSKINLKTNEEIIEHLLTNNNGNDLSLILEEDSIILDLFSSQKDNSTKTEEQKLRKLENLFQLVNEKFINRMNLKFNLEDYLNDFDILPYDSNIKNLFKLSYLLYQQLSIPKENISYFESLSNSINIVNEKEKEKLDLEKTNQYFDKQQLIKNKSYIFKNIIKKIVENNFDDFKDKGEFLFDEILRLNNNQGNIDIDGLSLLNPKDELLTAQYISEIVNKKLQLIKYEETKLMLIDKNLENGIEKYNKLKENIIAKYKDFYFKENGEVQEYIYNIPLYDRRIIQIIEKENIAKYLNKNSSANIEENLIELFLIKGNSDEILKNLNENKKNSLLYKTFNITGKDELKETSIEEQLLFLESIERVLKDNDNSINIYNIIANEIFISNNTKELGLNTELLLKYIKNEFGNYNSTYQEIELIQINPNLFPSTKEEQQIIISDLLEQNINPFQFISLFMEDSIFDEKDLYNGKENKDIMNFINLYLEELINKSIDKNYEQKINLFLQYLIKGNDSPIQYKITKYFEQLKDNNEIIENNKMKIFHQNIMKLINEVNKYNPDLLFNEEYFGYYLKDGEFLSKYLMGNSFLFEGSNASLSNENIFNIQLIMLKTIEDKLQNKEKLTEKQIEFITKINNINYVYPIQENNLISNEQQIEFSNRLKEIITNKEYLRFLQKELKEYNDGHDGLEKLINKYQKFPEVKEDTRKKDKLLKTSKIIKNISNQSHNNKIIFFHGKITLSGLNDLLESVQSQKDFDLLKSIGVFDQNNDYFENKIEKINIEDIIINTKDFNEIVRFFDILNNHGKENKFYLMEDKIQDLNDLESGINVQKNYNFKVQSLLKFMKNDLNFIDNIVSLVSLEINNLLNENLDNNSIDKLKNMIQFLNSNDYLKEEIINNKGSNSYNDKNNFLNKIIKTINISFNINNNEIEDKNQKIKNIKEILFNTNIINLDILMKNFDEMDLLLEFLPSKTIEEELLKLYKNSSKDTQFKFLNHLGRYDSSIILYKKYFFNMMKKNEKYFYEEFDKFAKDKNYGYIKFNTISNLELNNNDYIRKNENNDFEKINLDQKIEYIYQSLQNEINFHNERQDVQKFIQYYKNIIINSSKKYNENNEVIISTQIKDQKLIKPEYLTLNYSLDLFFDMLGRYRNNEKINNILQENKTLKIKDILLSQENQEIIKDVIIKKFKQLENDIIYTNLYSFDYLKDSLKYGFITLNEISKLFLNMNEEMKKKIFMDTNIINVLRNLSAGDKIKLTLEEEFYLNIELPKIIEKSNNKEVYQYNEVSSNGQKNRIKSLINNKYGIDDEHKLYYKDWFDISPRGHNIGHQLMKENLLFVNPAKTIDKKTSVISLSEKPLFVNAFYSDKKATIKIENAILDLLKGTKTLKKDSNIYLLNSFIQNNQNDNFDINIFKDKLILIKETLETLSNNKNNDKNMEILYLGNDIFNEKEIEFIKEHQLFNDNNNDNSIAEDNFVKIIGIFDEKTSINSMLEKKFLDKTIKKTKKNEKSLELLNSMIIDNNEEQEKQKVKFKMQLLNYNDLLISLNNGLENIENIKDIKLDNKLKEYNEKLSSYTNFNNDINLTKQDLEKIFYLKEISKNGDILKNLQYELLDNEEDSKELNKLLKIVEIEQMEEFMQINTFEEFIATIITDISNTSNIQEDIKTLLVNIRGKVENGHNKPINQSIYYFSKNSKLKLINKFNQLVEEWKEKNKINIKNNEFSSYSISNFSISQITSLFQNKIQGDIRYRNQERNLIKEMNNDFQYFISLDTLSSLEEKKELLYKLYTTIDLQKIYNIDDSTKSIIEMKKFINLFAKNDEIKKMFNVSFDEIFEKGLSSIYKPIFKNIYFELLKYSDSIDQRFGNIYDISTKELYEKLDLEFEKNNVDQIDDNEQISKINKSELIEKNIRHLYFYQDNGQISSLLIDNIDNLFNEIKYFENENNMLFSMDEENFEIFLTKQLESYSSDEAIERRKGITRQEDLFRIDEFNIFSKSHNNKNIDNLFDKIRKSNEEEKKNILNVIQKAFKNINNKLIDELSKLSKYSEKKELIEKQSNLFYTMNYINDIIFKNLTENDFFEDIQLLLIQTKKIYDMNITPISEEENYLDNNSLKNDSSQEQDKIRYEIIQNYSKKTYINYLNELYIDDISIIESIALSPKKQDEFIDQKFIEEFQKVVISDLEIKYGEDKLKKVELMNQLLE